MRRSSRKQSKKRADSDSEYHLIAANTEEDKRRYNDRFSSNIDIEFDIMCSVGWVCRCVCALVVASMISSFLSLLLARCALPVGVVCYCRDAHFIVFIAHKQRSSVVIVIYTASMRSIFCVYYVRDNICSIWCVRRVISSGKRISCIQTSPATAQQLNTHRIRTQSVRCCCSHFRCLLYIDRDFRANFSAPRAVAAR